VTRDPWILSGPKPVSETSAVAGAVFHVCTRFALWEDPHACRFFGLDTHLVEMINHVFQAGLSVNRQPGMGR